MDQHTPRLHTSMKDTSINAFKRILTSHFHDLISGGDFSYICLLCCLSLRPTISSTNPGGQHHLGTWRGIWGTNFFDSTNELLDPVIRSVRSYLGFKDFMFTIYQSSKELGSHKNHLVPLWPPPSSSQEHLNLPSVQSGRRHLRASKT